MESDIFDIIEAALNNGGYQVLDGNRNSIIVRHENSDTEYVITVVDMVDDL